MREVLTEILSQDPRIEVAGSASNAMDARQKIKELNPDVLTLDVEMPGMNGISFLERLMMLRPMPVVMVSAMTQRGADTTMRALMLGAVDFVGKPEASSPEGLEQYANTIRRKVKAAAYAKMPEARSISHRLKSRVRHEVHEYKDTVIAMGASTGGVEAVYQVLAGLPSNMPPILVTQHIPPIFSTSFARRINERVSLNVCEARDGQAIEPGWAYIAPGDRHLSLVKRGQQRVCKLSDGPRVNRHIPSVDVLFNSIAALQEDAIGILLTGMGDDGAAGLLSMRETGADTIVQDEKSSVVWGMPGAAVELDAANHILSLEKIADQLVSMTQDGGNIYNKARALQ
jgi:two-component system chemotaxis response regulator CheB